MTDSISGQWSRRQVLHSIPAALIAPSLHAGSFRTRPRIAAVVTEYRRYSHAQHILDRYLMGYGWNNQHHLPPVDLVSLYVDQQPENDLSQARAQEFPQLKIYPSIEEALTLGGEEMAVDGVLLIAEHGDYPKNEMGQTLYPRYEFFRRIVDVFEHSGRTAPVFNDKHLSWSWDQAKDMVDTADRMGFALMAGSSLPVTTRLPSVDLPLGCEVEEVVSVGVGGPDGYDIHSLEAVQSLVERRKGGETGVVALQAIRGDKFWDAMQAGSWDAGGWDPELVQACLCRSLELMPTRKGFNHHLPTVDEMKGQVADPIAYRYEYADGLKATIMLVEGIVQDITVAARLRDQPKPISTLMYVHPREVVNTFSPLVHHTETLFLTGKSPYPVERTLLTTGLTEAGVTSLHQNQRRLTTPHLNVRYQPEHQSTFQTSPNPAPVDLKRPRVDVSCSPRKRIAVITTIWTYLSHSQHITDRFQVGYPMHGEWHYPDMDVVSLWVDQHPKGDLSATRAEQFGFEVHPTIAEALRCGGSELAVDGVLLIGEHGRYPSNEKGQKLYPRYEWFEEIVSVFEQDNRAVPVFNDKHLSYDFRKAQRMVDASKRLNFPMLAGSSIPFTWRLPELEIPPSAEIEEVVMAGAGSSDAHDFHALEGLQSMVERRKGGESGVKSVQLLQGDDVWRAAEEGRWSAQILEAALSCSDELKGITLKDARPQDLLRSGVLPEIVEKPRAYIIDRNDGLRTTLLWLNGAVGDFLFAAKLKGPAGIVATQFLRSPGPNVHYSACLASNIEEMFATGKAPYPIERTLLVSGMLERCLDSMMQGNRRLETPELNVRYRVGDASQHARN
ncbi:MAG: hypothetical protein MK110_16230 [Fuerstiella sp.]|nr:hypothetical protein [Fuerstiella sp.]